MLFFIYCSLHCSFSGTSRPILAYAYALSYDPSTSLNTTCRLENVSFLGSACCSIDLRAETFIVQQFSLDSPFSPTSTAGFSTHKTTCLVMCGNTPRKLSSSRTAYRESEQYAPALTTLRSARVTHPMHLQFCELKLPPSFL